MIQHSHTKNKTPKSSPINAIEASSSPNDSIITANRSSNPATPEILAIQPKLENSPPTNRPYDQVLHRQTVLMWGSGNQQSNDVSPVNVSPSNTRSPCQTPKPNHSLSLFNNQTTIHAQQNPHNDKCTSKAAALEAQHNSHHIKWNGNGNNSNSGKEVISIFPIHHNNEAYTQSASANALHHSVDSHHSNHHLHRHSSDISNCEVWPTAYSQYQYFSYHHVPNAHHQHQASTQ